MTESEFIDYYASNTTELTDRATFTFEKKKEIIMELFKAIKCECGRQDCKGWKMRFRAKSVTDFLNQIEAIKQREGL